MQNLKKVISLHEASLISGYHQDYLSSLIRKNEIKGEKMGGNWFTTEEEIKSYIFKQRIKNKKWVVKHILTFTRANRSFIYAFIVLLILSTSIYFYDKQYNKTQAQNANIKTVDTQTTNTRFSSFKKFDAQEEFKELKF